MYWPNFLPLSKISIQQILTVKISEITNKLTWAKPRPLCQKMWQWFLFLVTQFTTLMGSFIFLFFFEVKSFRQYHSLFRSNFKTKSDANVDWFDIFFNQAELINLVFYKNNFRFCHFIFIISMSLINYCSLCFSCCGGWYSSYLVPLLIRRHRIKDRSGVLNQIIKKSCQGLKISDSIIFHLILFKNEYF